MEGQQVDSGPSGMVRKLGWGGGEGDEGTHSPHSGSTGAVLAPPATPHSPLPTNSVMEG